MSEIEGLNVHFVRVTASIVLSICKMSETLSSDQRKAVADNAISISQGFCSDNAWMRAIYADRTLVGFIMLHIGSDWEDGIDCPGVFLWRLMISKPYQGKGYGIAAVELLISHLRSLGIPELYTSYAIGPASPKGFYDRLGFKPTGDFYGEEPEVVLKLNTP